MTIIKESIKNVKVYDRSELKDIKEFFETGISPESERNAVKYSTPIVEFEADCVDFQYQFIGHFTIRIFMLVKYYEGERWCWRDEYYQQVLIDGEYRKPDEYFSGYSTKEMQMRTLKNITDSMNRRKNGEITLDKLEQLPLFDIHIDL